MTEIDNSTWQAIDGDRNASLALWRQVAIGDFNFDVHFWIKHVAEAVLDADSKPASVLRDRALKRALGLEGVADKHRALREFAESLTLFGFTRDELVTTVINGKLFPDTLDPSLYATKTKGEIGKLIDAELKKVKPKT